MRIRAMELPTEVVGELVKTPFLLVIDRCSLDDAEDLADTAPSFKETTGARGVLIFKSDVEVEYV